jgi:UPF0755 protein
MSQLVPFLTTDPLPPSRNDRSIVRRVVAALGMISLVIGVVWITQSIRSTLPDDAVAVAPGIPVVVVIESGDSLTTVGAKLVEANVVTSVSSFLAAAELEERSSMIGPGVYNLETGLPPGEAIVRMLDPAFRAAPLVLREGLRLTDTVRLTSEYTGLSEQQLQAALIDGEAIGLPGWALDRPEGFLFPASYDLLPDSTATEVWSTMVRRFNVAAAEIDLVARARQRGFTPYEVVIIASLTQAEAAPGDFAKVARVVYNRLEQGLPLQFDSTVNYALGTSTLLVTQDMLNVDSPYNTYRIKGLPPTPINSPGQEAMEAALEPADGDWLYFVTVDPRTLETRFTASYEEFLVFKAEFQRNYELMMQGVPAQPDADTDVP